jgi:hypothetical protein
MNTSQYRVYQDYHDVHIERTVARKINEGTVLNHHTLSISQDFDASALDSTLSSLKSKFSFRLRSLYEPAVRQLNLAFRYLPFITVMRAA